MSSDIHQKLTRYLQQYRQQYTQEVLREHLVKQGFSAGDVDAAVREVFAAQAGSKPPGDAPAPRKSEDENKTPLPKPGSSDFILVADDDPNVRALLVTYLRDGGYRATAVGDGLQAVIQAEGMRLQLMISDIEMPGFGSGVDAYRSLRDSPYVPKNLPVIFVTGMPPDDARKIVPTDDPLVRLLLKPIDFSDLNRCLKELLPQGPDA